MGRDTDGKDILTTEHLRCLDSGSRPLDLNQEQSLEDPEEYLAVELPTWDAA
jgi:hypothetical protein